MTGKAFYVYILTNNELHENAEAAITREKRLKRWDRKWKIELIQAQNPDWNDLYETIL